MNESQMFGWRAAPASRHTEIAVPRLPGASTSPRAGKTRAVDDAGRGGITRLGGSARGMAVQAPVPTARETNTSKAKRMSQRASHRGCVTCRQACAMAGSRGAYWILPSAFRLRWARGRGGRRRGHDGVHCGKCSEEHGAMGPAARSRESWLGRQSWLNVWLCRGTEAYAARRLAAHCQFQSVGDMFVLPFLACSWRRDDKSSRRLKICECC